MSARTRTVPILPVDQVQSRILIIRGQRVIINLDLARLYGVTTKRLNQQVTRNADRFPDDFMFQLTWEETAALRLQNEALNAPASSLRSQNVTSKRGAHVKYRPYAFTEHGAIMAANVLNSPEAVRASLFVVRAFVKLRELLSTHVQLAAKLDELERHLKNHDEQILLLFETIRDLMEPPDDPPKPPIGFHTEIAQPRLPKLKARRK